MPSMKNVDEFRKKLTEKNGVFGPFMITTDPAFVEAAGYAGFDFVLLDMEHGPASFETLQNLIRAANVADVMPVVRVPRGMDIWIDKALDVGAGAIMVPQIDDPQAVAKVIEAAKFSPKGLRGTNAYVRSAGYFTVDANEYFKRANDTVVIIQAEGQAAIDNLDEIIKIDGIDIVFVGPYDLSSSMGIIGQVDHPKVLGAISDVVEKCSKKGIAVGCFAGNLDMAKKLRDMGVKFIGYSCDTALFLRSAIEDIKEYSK